MEIEPIWLSKLRELDISKTVFPEFDGSRHVSTINKNSLYRILSATKDVLIIPQESFKNFYKSDINFKIGAFENLLIQIPSTEFFLNKLKEEYHIASGYSYTTYYGVVKDLPKTNIRTCVEYSDLKYADEDFRYGDYTIFVLGENLAFNKVKYLEDIKYKDSKAILFTYLNKLECFIFFLESYWEVKRTPPPPPPMSFNKFIGSENDTQQNNSLNTSDIDDLYKEIDKLLEPIPKKRKFLGIF